MTQTKTHQPCDHCGSSDALTYYENSSYCFSCHKQTWFDDDKQTSNRSNMTLVTNDLSTPPPDAVSRTIASRGITKATCERYGVVEDKHQYWFPYHDDDGIVAYKRRSKAEKKFNITGQWRDAKLFGQHLFNKGGKYVTVVEGEADCLATFQMLGSKYPVVSIRNGAGSAGADVKTNYEWLDSFDTIVVCMDNDDNGIEASHQIADVFGSKVKVFKHDPEFKDSCDYLSRGDEKLYFDKWWQAERFVPDGIVDGSTLWDEVCKPMEKALVSYPFEGLNKLTYGIREELVTITAGSGLGKSQFVRELVFHVLNNTTDNIGLMFLEESTRKTALSMMSLHANKPLHLPDTPHSVEEKRDAFEATLGTGRMFLFDHFGSTDIENILNRVRYLAKGLGCKYVFLDHVSIVVSAQADGMGDERKAIDSIMTKLRMLVQETGISLFVVSHLKRPDGKGHEEGAATSLSQLRGSGSIAQLSDIVLGLERNGQDPDVTERHTTHVRVLKNRFSGLTGPACRLLYDLDSGRMLERKDEEENVL